MRVRVIVSAGLLLAVATGCGGSSGSSGGTTSPTPTSSSAPVTPTVAMSIADNSRLTGALPWRVTVTAGGQDAVEEVDFLVDRKKLWVEHSSPYVFDDDHGLLAPWLLGNGTHVLTAHVVTVDGATADASAHVRIDVDVAGDRTIAGTYHRVVTTADQVRVRPYRTTAKGAFGEVSPTGRWTIHVKADGEIVGVDPTGDAGAPFIEPFTLKGSRLTLYGPAVWRQPDPGSPNLFCDPEKPSDYSVSLTGSSLTIRNVQKVCADRDAVLVGTWTRS